MTEEKIEEVRETSDEVVLDHPVSRHRGHRRRMAKRFAEAGFDGWREHEILERLLYEVLPRRNTNEVAHALIRRFGSLRGVLLAEPEELAEVRGIGPVSAKWLAALLPRFTENLLGTMRQSPVTDGEMLVLADWFLGYLAHPAAYVFFASDGRLLGAVPVENAEEEPEPEGRVILLIREADASHDLIRALAGHLRPRPDKVFALTKKRELRETEI